MKIFIGICTALLLLVSCGSNNSAKEETNSGQPLEPTTEIIEAVETIEEEPPVVVKDFSSLIFSVQLGISKQRPHWVLFENGTYLLFRKRGNDTEMSANAKDRLRKIINKSSTKNIPGKVKKSQLAKGWIVTFGDSGLYNYVDHKTLPDGINSTQTILERARLNLAMDYNDLNVIKVHK